jgi:hypothetical protein
MSKRTTNIRPTHQVFVVEGEGDKAFWTKIGAAWQHKDGDGFNVTLMAMPLDGRIVIRASKEPETRTNGRSGR